mgnify:CR=1 FL=1
MRPVPLFLKNIAMRIVYEKSAVANTTTITNIGNIKIKDIYQPYIEGFFGFYSHVKRAVSERNDLFLPGYAGIYI